MIDSREGGPKKGMYLEGFVMESAENLARQLQESGEESASFKMKQAGVDAEFIVQKTSDGIIPMAEIEVDGNTFYIGVKSAE